MKKLVLMLLVLLSVGVCAQAKKDTVNNKKLVVVNGKIFDRDISTINRDSIFTIDSLEKDDLTRSLPHAKNGIIVIVTKDAAIKNYQAKLSIFSKAYQSYLLAKNGDEHDLVYIINGVIVEKKSQIKQLYKLKTEKIKDVLFVKGEPDINRVTHLIVIATKH